MRRTFLSPFRAFVLGLWIFCLVIRFWNLGQFNELVFDEVYYAKFAGDYWQGNPFFPSHPPLSHYLIAIAMGIGQLFPVDPDQVNTLTGALRSTWSYRWLNALVGSTIPLLLGAIAYQLTTRRLFTGLVMIWAALDGLLVVESRYALNNIYLIFFGLAGQALVLAYLRCQQRWQLIWGGISLACAGSVKWNGFAFLLAVYVFWAIAWGLSFNNHSAEQPAAPGEDSLNEDTLDVRTVPFPAPVGQNFWQNWLHITPQQLCVWLVLVPLLTYSFIWIPHLLMNPEYASLGGFWRIQVETWQYHRHVGNSPDVHPYCSPWYSWPIMWRPVAYYYKTKGEHGLIYDVHSMANPVLLWLSTGALSILMVSLLLGRRRERSPSAWHSTLLFLGINYGVNLLPWLSVSRCTFFYHYLPSYLFSLFALALMVERELQHPAVWHKVMAGLAIVLVGLSFWFWLPLFIGAPLTPDGFSLRMLLRSWI